MTSAQLGLKRLPAVTAVERLAVPAPTSPGRGLSLGVAGPGTRAVLLDVNEGIVCAFDTATGARSDAVPVPTRQDPLTPGLVAVDDSGRRALVMAARQMHADPALLLVDLDRKTSEVVHALDGPGWLVGAFSARGVVVCEQRLGDEPRFSVLLGGKRVWSIEGMQPPCVPAAWSDEVLALVVCPRPDALTGTGATALCVLDVVGKSLAPLTPAAGTAVRKEGDALVVEGGPELVRVRLG